jgi:hypothetical protein
MATYKEHDLQSQCVKWFRLHYPHLSPLFFAVPNGAKRGKAEAAWYKTEGLNRGVSDLILQLPNTFYGSMNIEMKAGSKQSDAQVVYQQCIMAGGGYYCICNTFQEFQAQVVSYIASVPPSIMEQLRSLHVQREAQKVEDARAQYRKRIGALKVDMEVEK